MHDLKEFFILYKGVKVYPNDVIISHIELIKMKKLESAGLFVDYKKL